MTGAVVFDGFSLTRTDEVVDLLVAELPGEVVQEFCPVTTAITKRPLADSGIVSVLAVPGICSQPLGSIATGDVTALAQ
jgi:hypothetical protein